VRLTRVTSSPENLFTPQIGLVISFEKPLQQYKRGGDAPVSSRALCYRTSSEHSTIDMQPPETSTQLSVIAFSSEIVPANLSFSDASDITDRESSVMGLLGGSPLRTRQHRPWTGQYLITAHNREERFWCKLIITERWSQENFYTFLNMEFGHRVPADGEVLIESTTNLDQPVLRLKRTEGTWTVL
jgi:hypothetical protein